MSLVDLMQNILEKVNVPKTSDTNESKSDEVNESDKQSIHNEEIYTQLHENKQKLKKCEEEKIVLIEKLNIPENVKNNNMNFDADYVNKLNDNINRLKIKYDELLKENEELKTPTLLRTDITELSKSLCVNCVKLEKERDELKMHNYNLQQKFNNENNKYIMCEEKLKKLTESISASDKKIFDFSDENEKLHTEIKNLREEIRQLKLKKSIPAQNNSNNSNNSNPSNNIIMVNKPPVVYENDDRFSDYIFRNPRGEKNTYVKENVGEFLNKLFNSDDK
jgi:hypothetical protein